MSLTASRSIRFVLVACAAIWITASPSARQGAGTAAPPPNQTFRAGVDSVSVDAVVTDKQGRPVTDLTAQDFEIRESGKVQTVDTFKLIQTDDGRDDPSAKGDMNSFDDQARETGREDNRLFVIFLDDYHVRVQSSLAIRQRLARFVSELTPHDLVAISAPLLPVTGLTFSRDHDATAGVISAFQGRKYDYTPRNPIEERVAGEPPQAQEQFRNDITISALTRLCEYMGTLREGRKTILYVSEGMAGTMPAGITTHGGPGGNSITPGLPAANATRDAFLESATLIGQMREIFFAAARSNTAIYTMDPRGLVGTAFGAEDNVSINAGLQNLTEETDMLRVVADETDGRAIVGRNDPLPDLHQMVRDSSTYYLLGYTSSLAPRDGKFHEIQVRVKRKDVEVRARKGYWAYSADDIERADAASAKPKTAADVLSALDTLASATEPDRHGSVVVWMGAKRGAGPKAAVTLVWEAPATAPANAADAVDRATVTVTSIYGDELYRGDVGKDEQSGRAAGEVTFDAPAGTVNARVVSENAKGMRLDSVDASVEVPDFTATGPQLTVPFVYRGRTARDLQQVRALSAPVPTAARVFSRTERLLIRFSAYGPAGTSPTVTMRLLNQGGAAIADLPAPTPLGPSDFESELGLGSFPPGDYLIEFAAASNGETVKSLMAIRVKG